MQDPRQTPTATDLPTTELSGLKPLLVTQFLGATNDNVVRLAFALLIHQAFLTDLSTANLLRTIALAAFSLPFLLFSAYAGYWANRYSKTSVIVASKVLELAIMLFAAYMLIQGHTVLLILPMFFMGLQSTIFSPCKYGILPELLPREKLSEANGKLELWTFSAILIGTILAPQILSFENARLGVASTLVVLAALGVVSSYFIPKTASADERATFPTNPIKDYLMNFRSIRSSKGLFLALVAMTYFWAMCAYFQANIIQHATEHLHLSERGTGILLAGLALGIGAGSVFAGVTSRGKVELGLVPLGALGIAVFSTFLGVFPSSFFIVVASLFAFGLSHERYYPNASAEEATGVRCLPWSPGIIGVFRRRTGPAT